MAFSFLTNFLDWKAKTLGKRGQWYRFGSSSATQAAATDAQTASEIERRNKEQLEEAERERRRRQSGPPTTYDKEGNAREHNTAEWLAFFAVVWYCVEGYLWSWGNNWITYSVDILFAIIILVALYQAGVLSIALGLGLFIIIRTVEAVIANAHTMTQVMQALTNIGVLVIALFLLIILSKKLTQSDIWATVIVVVLLWLQTGGLEQIQIIFAELFKTSTRTFWPLSQAIWPLWFFVCKKKSKQFRPDGIRLSTIFFVAWIICIFILVLGSGFLTLFGNLLPSNVATVASEEALDRLTSSEIFEKLQLTGVQRWYVGTKCNFKGMTSIFDASVYTMTSDGQAKKPFDKEQCIKDALGIQATDPYVNYLEGDLDDKAAPGGTLRMGQSVKNDKIETDISRRKVEGRFVVSWEKMLNELQLKNECVVTGAGKSEEHKANAILPQMGIGKTVQNGAEPIVCSMPAKEFFDLDKDERSKMVMRTTTINDNATGADPYALDVRVHYWGLFMEKSAFDQKVSAYEESEEAKQARLEANKRNLDPDSFIFYQEVFKGDWENIYPEARFTSKYSPDGSVGMIMEIGKLPFMGIKQGSVLLLQMAVENRGDKGRIVDAGEGYIILPEWLEPLSETTPNDILELVTGNDAKCAILDAQEPETVPCGSFECKKYHINDYSLQVSWKTLKENTQYRLPVCPLVVTMDPANIPEFAGQANEMHSIEITAAIQYNYQLEASLPISESNIDPALAGICQSETNDPSQTTIALQETQLPCLSIDTMDQLLSNANSPLENKGNRIFQLSASSGVDPRLFLAIFNITSGYGKRGSQPWQITVSPEIIHNPGNLAQRPSAAGPERFNIRCEDYGGTVYTGFEQDSANLCKFTTWDKGMKAWFDYTEQQIKAGFTTTQGYTDNYDGMLIAPGQSIMVDGSPVSVVEYIRQLHVMYGQTREEMEEG